MGKLLAVLAVWAGLLGYFIPAAFSAPPGVAATAASATTHVHASHHAPGGESERSGNDHAGAGLPAHDAPAAAPDRAAPHRTAPHRTAPHRTAPHRTAPQPQNAKVRVIQASLRARRVTVTLGGRDLAANQPFGSVTQYRSVRAGTWIARAAGAGERVAIRVTLVPGTASTLVVLDGHGRLALSASVQRQDIEKTAALAATPAAASAAAASTAATPKPGRSPLSWLLLGAAVLVVGLAGAARLRQVRWARRVAARVP
jgi:hypothetical protein